MFNEEKFIEEDEEKNEPQSKNNEDKFRFYYDKKTTDKVPQLLSEKNIEEVKKAVNNRKDVPVKYEKKI